MYQIDCSVFMWLVSAAVCPANMRTVLGVGWLLWNKENRMLFRNGCLQNEAIPSADMFKDKAARKLIS